MVTALNRTLCNLYNYCIVIYHWIPQCWSIVQTPIPHDLVHSLEENYIEHTDICLVILIYEFM